MDIVQVAEGELKTAMLDSKDAFILDAGKGGVYVWIGKECTMMEREKAMETGAKYLNKRKLPEFTVLTRVLETAEPTSFSQWCVSQLESPKIISGSRIGPRRSRRRVTSLVCTRCLTNPDIWRLRKLSSTISSAWMVMMSW